jgi:DNA-binding MarR family transcriptional regulator
MNGAVSDRSAAPVTGPATVATTDATDGRTGRHFRDPLDEHARRIGRAWIELRRGARTTELRDYLYGDEDRLEQGQMDALDLLVRRDRTMSGLAERLRIDPSTATRSVQRMVDAGLVERVPSAADGRIVVVRPTPAGERAHAAVAARRAHAMGLILDAFAPDERAQLADLLDRFVEALDDVVSTLH